MEKNIFTKQFPANDTLEITRGEKYLLTFRTACTKINLCGGMDDNSIASMEDAIGM